MKATDEGTDNLFQQHTIKEIQEIEKKLRNDIEKKKEDLRQMVGERYQDLMNAADTITDMKRSAESVTQHIKVMEERCNAIYNQATPSGILPKLFPKVKTDQQSKPQYPKYVLGTQIKIIMDIPSMLWSCIDDGKYLKAAQLFLLSQHVTNSLSFDPKNQLDGMPIAKAFPLIVPQIALIGRFRYTIQKACRETLKKNSLSKEELVDIFCSLLLLDKTTPKDLLQELLEKRLDLVDSIMEADKEDSSIKSEVCDVVRLISNTIELIGNIFFSRNGEKSLLLESYLLTASKNKPGPVSYLQLEFSPSYIYLPENIKTFYPSVNEKLTSITPQELQKCCQDWIEKIKILVNTKLTGLLNYVNTVKGLADVRNTVDAHLIQLSPEEEWLINCNTVIGCPFSFHEDLLGIVFAHRVQGLLETSSKSAFINFETSLQHLLNNLLNPTNLFEYERDLTKFIWIETATDLTLQPGWLTSNNLVSPSKVGTLMVKANGYTPQVQNLCNQLDTNLKSLLEDFYYFSLSEDGNVNTKYNQEMTELKVFIKKVVTQEVNRILELTDQKISKENSSDYIEACLPIIGRICHALTELCPNFKKCYSDEINEKESLDWKNIQQSILKMSKKSFCLWALFMVGKHLTDFNLNLTSCSPSSFLQNILTWDEIEINEETEDGNKVKSTIRVPLQASTFLQSLLKCICQEINRTIGHALPREITQLIGKEILQKTMLTYEEALCLLHKQSTDSSRFVQTFSLQLLFDLHYLSRLLTVKDDNETVEKLINGFESLIDPFDLDVFSSPLQQNLTSALQKSMLLFGLLLSDRVGLAPAQRHTNQNQTYNLLMATSGVSRFQLLPSSKKTEQTIPTYEPVKQLNAPRMSRGFNSSPSLGSVLDSEHISKSLYDRFSAMNWFGSAQN